MWFLYDQAYKRRAEATKNLSWSDLIQQQFGGRAGRHVICQICLSDHHSAERCLQRINSVGGRFVSGRTTLATLPYQQLQHQSIAVRPQICCLSNAKEIAAGSSSANSRCKSAGHSAQQCSLSIEGAPPVKQPCS